MAEVDARIPLMAQTAQPITVNALIQMRQLAQQRQAQNALRQIYSTPGAIGPDGMPTPNAMRNIMAIDPRFGMQLAGQVSQMAQRRAAAGRDALAIQQAKLKAAQAPTVAGYEAQQQALANGATSQQAQRAAQDAFAAARQQVVESGVLGDGANELLPPTYNPALGAGISMTPAQSATIRAKQQEADALAGYRAQQVHLAQERIDKPSFAIVTGAQTASGAPVVINRGTGVASGVPLAGANATPPGLKSAMDTATRMVNSKKWTQEQGDQYVKMAADAAGIEPQSPQSGQTAPASALPDGVEPTKSGFVWRNKNGFGNNASPDQIDSIARLIGTYQMAPLSGYAAIRGSGPAIMAKVQELYPNWSAQNYNQSNKAVTAFGAGKQGDLTKSANVAVQHLGLLGDLVGALGNGNVPRINAAKQKYAEETGSPAPSNFDFAKQIVGDEVAKFVIGGNFTEADRKGLQEQLSRAKSPQQLEGVIKTAIGLMHGQIVGLRQQYNTSTYRDDFDDRYLSPQTRSYLGIPTGPDPNAVGAPGAGSGSSQVKTVSWSDLK